LKKNPNIARLDLDRAERPDQVKIARMASQTFAQAELGETKAIACVSLLNGGRVHSAAFAGLTEMDRLALIGALHRLIGAIEAHEDQQVFDKQPD
jgi:hypothetical protein